MADILFKCPKCSNVLAVDVAGAAQFFPCPDCGQPIQAPQPALMHICPSCQSDIFLPKALEGETFHCPNCENGILVPLKKTQRLSMPDDLVPPHGIAPSISDGTFSFVCPLCQQSLEAEVDLAGVTIKCPGCNKPLRVPMSPVKKRAN